MGQIIRVNFRRNGSKSKKISPGVQTSKWSGLEILVGPEPDLKKAELQRYLLHAVLYVFCGRNSTKRLTTDFVTEGGVFEVRCSSDMATTLREVISTRIPEFVARRKRRFA